MPGTRSSTSSDPARPELLARIPAGHTHKNWWECDTGIAYLVSGNQPPWRVRRMTQVFDLNDPANPKHIRDFGLPGQQIKEGETPSQQHGEHGAIPTELHGGISTGPAGNRIYFGYGTNSGGIVQIVDRGKLIEGPGGANRRQPAGARGRPAGACRRWSARIPPIRCSGMPIPEFARDAKGATRDMLMIVDEALKNECRDEARQMVWFADITVESQPMVVSNFTVPEASGDFCSRGGRFGSHSSNESMAPVFHRKLAFIAWFNAGVRALDIRNPYRPREVGFYIPAITERPPALRDGGRPAALQAGDPDEQRRVGRARLCLYRRPGEYRRAYPGGDGRGARHRRAALRASLPSWPIGAGRDGVGVDAARRYSGDPPSPASCTGRASFAAISRDVAALEAGQLQLVRARLPLALAAGDGGRAIGRAAADLVQHRQPGAL